MWYNETTMNKEKTIKFRVTANEYEAIKKMASAMHMNVTEYMRFLAFNLAKKIKKEG
jgi:uncharacterized protein (DUF1778 family)